VPFKGGAVKVGDEPVEAPHDGKGGGATGCDDSGVA
jgi:hypothetical protein